MVPEKEDAKTRDAELRRRFVGEAIAERRIVFEVCEMILATAGMWVLSGFAISKVIIMSILPLQVFVGVGTLVLFLFCVYVTIVLTNVLNEINSYLWIPMLIRGGLWSRLLSGFVSYSIALGLASTGYLVMSGTH